MKETYTYWDKTWKNLIEIAKDKVERIDKFKKVERIGKILLKK